MNLELASVPSLANDRTRPAAAPRGKQAALQPSARSRKARGRKILNLALTLTGALLIGVCGLEAWCRYTGVTPSLFDWLHAAGWLGATSGVAYEPGKGFGYDMGRLGGTLIFLTLGYPLRKYVLRSTRFGSLPVWLDVHIFFGITGTAIITLHTMGRMHGIVAICYAATLMAFASGVVGRFLYVLLPRQVSGRAQELSSLEREAAALADRLESELGRVGLVWDRDSVVPEPVAAGLAADVRKLMGQQSRSRRDLKALRQRLRAVSGLDAGLRRRTEELAEQALVKQRELRTYELVQHLFGSWHRFHLPFTYTLFAILALHVTVAMLFYVKN